MNKVICDVCGTSYPETETSCPICGSTMGELTQGVEEDVDVAPKTYAKGGHFSKSNVRKRNRAAAAPVEHEYPMDDLDSEEPEQKESSNKGLLIAVIALLLAIIAVIIFIIARWTLPNNKDKDNSTTTTAAATTEVKIPCTGLTVVENTVSLNSKDASWQLNLNVSPEDTTDEIIYVSSDESIATVSSNGVVTAVGPGQALITITCGEYQTKCRVVCNFEGVDPNETVPEITEPEETTAPSETDPTEEPTEAPTTKPEETNTFKLNRTDITFKKAGDKWVLYTGSVAKKDIKWSSDDESIATFENGIVVAVGPGKTKVHAEYDGVKVTCIIRCRWEESTEETTTPPETTQPEDNSTSYEIWINGKRSKWGDEATITVGNSFKITLVGNEGNVVNVSWSSSNTDICVVNGNTVKGVAVGKNVKITCEYKGVTYTCTVIVKAK